MEQSSMKQHTEWVYALPVINPSTAVLSHYLITQITQIKDPTLGGELISNKLTGHLLI